MFLYSIDINGGYNKFPRTKAGIINVPYKEDAIKYIKSIYPNLIIDSINLIPIFTNTKNPVYSFKEEGTNLDEFIKYLTRIGAFD